MSDYQYPNIIFDESSDQEDFYREFLSKFFVLKELFNGNLVAKYGEKCLQFVDIRLLKTIYLMRVFFNKKMRINDYKLGLSNRLVRFPDSSDYRPGSEHSVGIDSEGKIIKRSTAVDFDVIGLSAEQTRKIIRDNSTLTAFAHINRLEKGVGWVHADLKVLPVGVKRIYEFLP
jgi:hypothetical protein